MQRKQAEELLERYKQGTCTKEELALIEDWYAHYANNQPSDFPFDLESMEGELYSRLPKPRNKFKTYMPIAAAILSFCMALSLIFWLNNKTDQEALIAQETTLIQAGKNTAFLTLGNGQVMELDSNRSEITITPEGLFYSDGTVLLANTNANDRGQLNTISTPKGGQYQIQLPDGTKVWLNAASSLTYPSKFHASRRVKLEGEAYFEVKPQQQQMAKGMRSVPFIVETALQEIKVLGTHFNVDAYADERETRTTLVEGAVEVVSFTKSGESSPSIFLQPNQQSIVSAQTQGIRVKNIDPSSIIAWKDGFFSFQKEGFQNVMRKFGRWYNVDFDFQGDIPTTTFSGKIYRGEQITKVYDFLDFYNIDYQVQGRKIILRTQDSNGAKK